MVWYTEVNVSPGDSFILAVLPVHSGPASALAGAAKTPIMPSGTISAVSTPAHPVLMACLLPPAYVALPSGHCPMTAVGTYQKPRSAGRRAAARRRGPPEASKHAAQRYSVRPAA